MGQITEEEQKRLRGYAERLSETQSVYSLSTEERSDAILLLEKYIALDNPDFSFAQFG